jgi:hypothetical protein
MKPLEQIQKFLDASKAREVRAKDSHNRESLAWRDNEAQCRTETPALREALRLAFEYLAQIEPDTKHCYCLGCREKIVARIAEILTAK